MPKTVKDGAYVINLDEYADAGTHWIALYCRNIEIIYLDSFEVEHLPKDIEKFIGYNQTFQECADTSALDSLILYLQVKLWMITLVCFLLMTFRKITI